MPNFCSLSPAILMVVKIDMVTHVIVTSFLPSSILDVMKSVQHRWRGTKYNQNNSEFSPLCNYVFPFCMIGMCMNSYVYERNYFWMTTDDICLYISYLKRKRVFTFPGGMLTSVQARIECKFLPESLQWMINQGKWKNVILWNFLSCRRQNLNVIDVFRRNVSILVTWTTFLLKSSIFLSDWLQNICWSTYLYWMCMIIPKPLSLWSG